MWIDGCVSTLFLILCLPQPLHQPDPWERQSHSPAWHRTQGPEGKLIIYQWLMWDDLFVQTRILLYNNQLHSPMLWIDMNGIASQSKQTHAHTPADVWLWVTPFSLQLFSPLSFSIPIFLCLYHLLCLLYLLLFLLFCVPLYFPALLKSDEGRPAAINSGSVGEMTASDDLPHSKTVYPFQTPSAVWPLYLLNVILMFRI